MYICRLDQEKTSENTCVRHQCCHVPFQRFLAYPTNDWSKRKPAISVNLWFATERRHLKSFYINPRLKRGGGGRWLVASPLTVFYWSLENPKESDLGHIDNPFYILCGRFDEKMGIPPYPGIG